MAQSRNLLRKSEKDGAVGGANLSPLDDWLIAWKSVPVGSEKNRADREVGPGRTWKTDMDQYRQTFNLIIYYVCWMWLAYYLPVCTYNKTKMSPGQMWYVHNDKVAVASGIFLFSYELQ